MVFILGHEILATTGEISHIMYRLTLFSLILTIWIAKTVAQITSMNAARTNRQLTVCYLIERNGVGSIYDYNKAAAALDMALEYANNNILPSHLRLSRYCTVHWTLPSRKSKM